MRRRVVSVLLIAIGATVMFAGVFSHEHGALAVPGFVVLMVGLGIRPLPAPPDREA
jgi:membrane-bound ClpP family serine protease